MRRIKKIEKRLERLEKEIKYEFLQPNKSLFEPFSLTTMQEMIELILDYLNLEVHKEYVKPEHQVLKKIPNEKEKEK